MHIRSGIVVLGIASSVAAQAVIVDVDATIHCSATGIGAEIELPAGVYLVTPIGPPEGEFIAWNAWGSVSGCDPAGLGCSTGWLHRWAARDAAAVTVGSGGAPDIYATPEQALAAAPLRQLRICETGTVIFLVGDSLCTDNDGGVSLRIEPSGCPADLTVDGSLDFFDFLEFQNLFAAGSRRADFDCSGTLDFFDFLAFQNEFAAGCP